MKIRTGFVSNSSSTSFAVSTEDYPTVRDLAIKMMSIRNEDWDEYDDEALAKMTLRHSQTGDEELFSQIKEIIESPNRQELIVVENSKLDRDFPIAFKSTNYDTFLMKSGNLIFVSTCNNHDWHSLPLVIPSLDQFNLEDFRAALSDREYKEITSAKHFKEDIHEAIESYLKYATDFWWPKHNRIIRQFRFANRNDHCKNKDRHRFGPPSLVLCDGKLVCPVCDLDFGEYW